MLSKPVLDYPVSSTFGERIHPVTGVLKMHWGIDYTCPLGTPILAAASGQIISAKSHPEFGNYILQRLMIDNVIYFLFYCHLSKFHVNTNVNSTYPFEMIEEGDVIGEAGNTGLSTGHHLHFQVCKDSAIAENYKFNAIDPETLFKEDTLNIA